MINILYFIFMGIKLLLKKKIKNTTITLDQGFPKWAKWPP